MAENISDALDQSTISSSLAGAVKSKSLADIGRIANFAKAMLEEVRNSMVAPDPCKVAPTYSMAQLSALCGIDKAKGNYIVTSNPGELPIGTIVGGNRKREFTLEEAMQWVHQFAPFGKRPKNTRGKKMCIGNFKGGVTKTTTALALAQGLALRGRKVLLVDLDPQGSLTTLCGILVYPTVTQEKTIMPYIYGDEPNLSYAAKETYWKGIDLIPACGMVAHAEFQLPAMQAQDSSFEFWNVLNEGIEPLLDIYDVVIFDTPPALSYLTINALMASDSIIVPSPPNALDYASSVQFWSLFADFSKTFMKIVPELANKKYDFISVLMSKVENNKQATSVVKDWINLTYKDMVLPVEIALTSGALSAAAQFGTAYDISNYGGVNKVYQRTRDEYDAFVGMIDGQLMKVWKQEELSND